MESETPTTVTRIETETINSSSENPALLLVVVRFFGSIVMAPRSRSRAAGPLPGLRILRDIAGQCISTIERSSRVRDSDYDHAHAVFAGNIGDRDGSLHFVIDGKLDQDVIGSSQDSIGARLDNSVR